MPRTTCSAPRVQWFGKNDTPLKAAWKEVVYAHLEAAYREIGGINLGSGFQDPEEMLNSIPVWRLVFEKDRLTSVMVFKQKRGCLKMVAYAAGNASQAVKQNDLKCMVRYSYAEISGGLLVAVLKQFGPSVRRHLLSANTIIEDREIFTLQEVGSEVLESAENVEILARLKRDFPEIVPYLYVRKIGGKAKVKLVVGRLYKGADPFIATRVMAQGKAVLKRIQRKALAELARMRAGVNWSSGLIPNVG